MRFNRAFSFLNLFTSMSTLVCCALPALFVTLGAGATFAGIVTRVPGLIWLSEHKVPLFLFGGTMLILGGIGLYRAKNLPCPLDPELARSCDQARRWSTRTYFLSLAVYGIGAFFAFGSSLIQG